MNAIFDRWCCCNSLLTLRDLDKWHQAAFNTTIKALRKTRFQMISCFYSWNKTCAWNKFVFVLTQRGQIKLFKSLCEEWEPKKLLIRTWQTLLLSNFPPSPSSLLQCLEKRRGFKFRRSFVYGHDYEYDFDYEFGRVPREPITEKIYWPQN